MIYQRGVSKIRLNKNALSCNARDTIFMEMNM